MWPKLMSSEPSEQNRAQLPTPISSGLVALSCPQFAVRSSSKAVNTGAVYGCINGSARGV
jgi:hypothetical protein